LGLFRTHLKKRWSIDIQINITRLRIPTGGRQTSWLFTSAAEKLDSGLPRTTSASGQNGIWTQDLQISNPALQPLGHAASTLRSTYVSFVTQCFYFQPLPGYLRVVVLVAIIVDTWWKIVNKQENNLFLFHSSENPNFKPILLGRHFFQSYCHLCSALRYLNIVDFSTSLTHVRFTQFFSCSKQYRDVQYSLVSVAFDVIWSPWMYMKVILP